MPTCAKRNESTDKKAVGSHLGGTIGQCRVRALMANVAEPAQAMGDRDEGRGPSYVMGPSSPRTKAIGHALFQSAVASTNSLSSSCRQKRVQLQW